MIRLLLKRKAWKRLKQLRVKQAARISRIRAAIDELNKWSDIPVSWQYDTVCGILKIRNDGPAQRLVKELCFNHDVEELAKRLPLV